MIKPLSTFLFAALLAVASSPDVGRLASRGCSAAEFDLDSGRVILRRLQYCLDCGSALLVTDVATGTMVRCPDCGREQPRLENRHLLTQLYQICKLCAGPLDPHDHHPGDVVECPTCHTKQELSRDVFATGENSRGLGFVPGFPPGTGKKKLLLSPNRAEARITAIPLDEGSGELPLPPETAVLKKIPPPPEEITPLPQTAMPPMPELAPGVVRGGRNLDRQMSELAAQADGPAAAAASGPSVEVPAVTADLFGGAAPDAAIISSGKAVARVNGIAIHDRDVERIVAPVMERLRQQAGPEDAETVARREKELRREVLERLVDRELVLREAAALGHKPDPAAVRERENELVQIAAGTGVDLRREAERDVTMADMRRRYAEKPGAANPKEVREFYQKHKNEMMRPRLVALDQLVIYEDRATRADRRRAEEIAFEVSRSLEQGQRFDDLRDRYDEFLPAAGIPHAEPVLQPESAYSRQVLAAGGDLRRGAVFGPVPLAGMLLFGKVVDERPAGPIPFEEVEKEIRRRLENEATEKNLDAWIKRLRNKAKIEILP